GGGYEWLDVVPRAWTHLAAIAFGAPIAPDTDLPVGFTDFVMRALGRTAPARMTDGRVIPESCWDGRINPEDMIDRAILATRKAVFPHLGIDIDDWHVM
ncbi:MAG TPA: acetoin utilization protein AcuC, partial [Actinomycetota bacterium]|nr:acetoin utilization protein AcuC [Actinomycetota bacterium]